MAYYYISFTYKERVAQTGKGHGMRLAFLKKSNELFSALATRFKNIPKEISEKWIEQFQLIKQEYEEADHENKTTYFDPVAEELDEIEEI